MKDWECGRYIEKREMSGNRVLELATSTCKVALYNELFPSTISTVCYSQYTYPPIKK